MAKHDWIIKTLEDGRFWIVCQGCWHSDMTLPTLEAAESRVLQLKSAEKAPKKAFSGAPKLGTARRMRLEKARRKRFISS